jgi:transposase
LSKLQGSREDRLNVHKNARLTPKSRAEVVRRIAHGESKSAVACAFGICVKTVGKWFGRYKQEGEAGLLDRSSRPHRLRNPTCSSLIEQVIDLRGTRMPGKEIARRLSLSATTVTRILRAVKLSRIKDLSPPVVSHRYERQRPYGRTFIVTWPTVILFAVPWSKQRWIR